MLQKSPVEKLIVVRPGAAVPAQDSRLYNTTTGVLVPAVGSIGFYTDVAGSGNPLRFNPATYAGEPFRVIQRRDKSKDVSVLPDRTLEESQYIHGNCGSGIVLGAEGFSAPSNSSWVMGAPNAATSGKIAVDSNILYKLQAAGHGWKMDMYHSIYNVPVVAGRFLSPDWTTTGIAQEVDRRDYTVKALVRDFNLNSSVGLNNFAVAMAIDTAGNTAGPTLADIVTAGAGVTYVIGYENNCKPVSMLVDDARLKAISDLEDALIADFSIVAGTARLAPYALPENCSTATEIAGDTSATADMVFVIAIDEQPAAYDYVVSQRVRLDVSLAQGSMLSSAKRTMISLPKEGEGSGRLLKLWHENVEEYNSYTSSRSWGANHVAYGNEVLENENYDIFTFTHCHNRTATSGIPSQSPLLTAIAVVNTASPIGTTPFSTGAVNPQKTYVQAVVNAVRTHYGLNGPYNL
jgi:hypothetical protein